jgi:hypothetical protein
MPVYYGVFKSQSQVRISTRKSHHMRRKGERREYREIIMGQNAEYIKFNFYHLLMVPFPATDRRSRAEVSRSTFSGRRSAYTCQNLCSAFVT